MALTLSETFFSNRICGIWCLELIVEMDFTSFGRFNPQLKNYKSVANVTDFSGSSQTACRGHGMPRCRVRFWIIPSLGHSWHTGYTKYSCPRFLKLVLVNVLSYFTLYLVLPLVIHPRTSERSISQKESRRHSVSILCRNYFSGT